MALTQESEQRLLSVGLITYFTEHQSNWQNVMKDAYEFVKKRFPPNATIRKDDVAKVLTPIVEVEKGFQDKRKEGKLREKYWNQYFTDLIIDRTWDNTIKSP